MRTPRDAGWRQGRNAGAVAGLAVSLLSMASMAQEAPPAYPPPTYPPPTSAPSDPPVYSTPSYSPAPSDPSAQAYPPPAYSPGGQAATQPAYPPPQGAPGYGVPQASPAGGSMRQFFATSIAVLAQATGTTLVAGLTQAITGGLNDWFARKTKASQATGPLVGMTAPHGAPVYAPSPGDSAQPTYSPTPTDLPAPSYLEAPAYGPTSEPVFYNSSTGSAVAPDPVFSTPTDDTSTLFAGLAYEVHGQLPGGGTMPVHPATHVFNTGDRFIVLYRPTLPGRIDVYNINPLGVQTQIDSVEIAAAQLATLGPYEFTATKGEDRLRLVLTPCSTPRLLATTRDIVRVQPAEMTASGDFRLAACTPVMRSATANPVTRDIRKVAVENNTGFALDPVSAQERGSGELAPREVTIVFRHQ